MSYEVELKFPVSDLSVIVDKIAALDAVVSAAHDAVDLYLAHPARDFARTDEGLRLRRKGDANCITYKGPKIDATTKSLWLEPDGCSLEWSCFFMATTLSHSAGYLPEEFSQGGGVVVSCSSETRVTSGTNPAARACA